MSDDTKLADKKQSRLPFKVLDVTKTLSSPPTQLKKRKLSGNEAPPTSVKVFKKEEENIDIANLGASPTKCSNEHLSNKTLETGKDLNDIKDDDLDSNMEMDVKSNSDKEADCKVVELSSSGEDEKKEESGIDFSRTETSELDASFIFEQGSLLGESAGTRTLFGKKKKRQSPMNPKKLEELEKRKREKLRLRAEREKQLQEARQLKKKQKEDEKLERERKKLEEKELKCKELEDKRLKDQKEREEKLRLKQEKKEKEEQERLEKLKAKEEEKRKKQRLLNEKNDEKKRKEEERIKKLEEKKKADEEEERKKLKEKAVFKKFFIKNDTSPTLQQQGEDNGIFKPFEVMKNMTLASVIPDVASNLFNKDDFESACEKQDTALLYVEELKAGQRIPLFKNKSSHDKNKEGEDDELIILDENTRITKEKHKAKLLQFSENVRPPYYGTWMKSSSYIKARNPFTQDTAFFDYEVDSDEEWEEGGPGESLSDSDEEKESEDDYEVDNEFFVPHGYLSADEEKDDELGDSPEHLQKRLKMRQLEFQEELKKKCSEMKPRVTGCLWICEEHPREKDLAECLRFNAAVLFVSFPIVTSLHSLNVEHGGTATPNTPANYIPDSSNGAKKTLWKKFPQEAMRDFIKLIHGNTNGRHYLLKEFQEFWLQKTSEEEKVEETRASEETEPLQSTPNSDRLKMRESSPNVKISKRQLEITFNKIASWTRSPDPALNRVCWWVHEATRNEYIRTDLPIPNQWNYLTRKDPEASPSSAKQKTSPADDKTPSNITRNSSDSTPSIRKFAKVILPKLTLTPDNKKRAVKINSNQIQSTLPNETKATLSDTNKLSVPKTPLRVVPSLKNTGSSSPLIDTRAVKVLDKDEKQEGSDSDANNKKSLPSPSSLLNFVKPNYKMTKAVLEIRSDSPKNKREDVKHKSLTDSTPSILKFVKRITPVTVRNLERPKLPEDSNPAINLE